MLIHLIFLSCMMAVILISLHFYERKRSRELYNLFRDHSNKKTLEEETQP